MNNIELLSGNCFSIFWSWWPCPWPHHQTWPASYDDTSVYQKSVKPVMRFHPTDRQIAWLTNKLNPIYFLKLCFWGINYKLGFITVKYFIHSHLLHKKLTQLSTPLDVRHDIFDVLRPGLCTLESKLQTCL